MSSNVRHPSIAAARASRSTLLRQRDSILHTPTLQQLFDAVGEMVMVLNPQRQIVLANDNLLHLLGVDDPKAVLGLRPGEAMHCLRAAQGPDGCGSSVFCRACGNLQAIVDAHDAPSGPRECRILRNPDGQAMDLRVRATPLEIGGESMTVFAIADISHEKRRRALERIFFHDLMNTAVGLKMLSETITPAGELQGLSEGLGMLVEEIAAQRDLAAAESHELKVQPSEVRSAELLRQLVEQYRPFEATHGCRLVVTPGARDLTLRTDRTILRRVLGNMIKNAVEASSRGQRVSIGCSASRGGVRFRVHNESAIPRDVQLQLFQRSFSTKGNGRGLGTYSIKLLTERYLQGEVSFISRRDKGTTFYVWCPRSLVD